MSIEAVVFDIGNVLLEWAPERVFDAAIGPERRREMFDAVSMMDVNRRIDLGAPFTETLTAHAAAHPDWHKEIMIWHDRWLDMASPEIPHSVRLMRALRARGIPVFSLTNFGTDTYDLAARHFPFLREFDLDFISGHLQVIKPDPAIYEIVETRSGLSGDALLFTDDREDNIAAASDRGWQTHLFRSSQGWAERLVAEGLLTRAEAE